MDTVPHPNFRMDGNRAQHSLLKPAHRDMTNSETTQTFDEMKADPRVLAKQVELLYRGLPVSLLATVLLGAILAVAMAPAIGTTITGGWIIGVILIAVARGLDGLHFKRSFSPDSASAGWLNRFTTGTAWAGVGWAAAGWFLFTENDPQRQALLTLTLAGIAAGAVTTLSARRRTIVPYILLVLAPIFLRYLLSDVPMSGLISVLLLIFGAVILSAARRISLTLMESAILRIQAVDREQILQANSELLRHTGDLARVGGWEFSVRSGELRWTEEMYLIHELPVGVVPDLDGVLNFFGTDARERVREAFTRAIEDGTPFDMEVPFSTARGRRLWVRAKGQPVERQGRVVLVRGALQDITDEKANEQELQKAVDALSLVYRLAAGSDADLNTRINEVLKLGTETFGVPYSCVSRIDGGDFLVQYAHGPEGGLVPGSHFELANTYCELTVQGADPTAAHHVEMSDLRNHPAYAGMAMEAYIAAPVRVHGEPYGTISFFGRAPRLTPFSEIELSLIGLFAHWVGNELTRDVTLKRLAESEERFQHAVTGSSDGIWDWDLENDALYVSPRFLELVGYGPEEIQLTADAWFDRIHPDDRGPAARAREAHLKTRKPFSVEYRALHRNGEFRWFLSRGQAVWNEAGEPVRMAGSLTDITEKRSDQALLEEAIAVQQATLDATPYGIVSIDPSGVIRSINHGAATLLQISAEDVIGTETPVQFHLEEELAKYAEKLSADVGREFDTPLEALLYRASAGVVEETEWTFQRRDGHRFPGALSLASIRDRHGRPMGFVGVYTDHTERKKGDRLKNEFVSTVSHELRTPLTSITGALSLLLKGVAGPIEGQANALVEMAHRNSERLILLINDILDMERISAGEMRFDFRVQELMPLVEQSLDATESYGDKFGIGFQISTRVDDARLNVDAHRFGQIMANLLSNAAKFSPSGTTVEIDITRKGRFIRTAVTDHGDGIPVEFQDRIFQKFSQADGSDVKKLGGTGLGLSITRAMVEKMDGHIDFVTQTGVGTTFFVDLPEWSSERLATSGEDSDHQRVLIVEDDAEVADILRIMLTDQGFDAVVAEDGRRAQEMLRGESFDAMTLDLNLPDVDGLEMLREMREGHRTRNMPVVVVSARADEGRAEAEDQFDLVDWLQKPIHEEDLADAVRRATESAGPKLRILHIEDDDTLADVVSQSMDADWSVRWASTMKGARAILQAEPFDVVLLDLGLPDGSGWDLIEAIRENTGNPRVIIFSGTEVSREEEDSVAMTVVKGKSTPDELLQAIRDVISEEG
jgi:PAS domain S-box-containing protein